MASVRTLVLVLVVLNMRIIDISQPLDTTTAVWPGDQPFGLDWTMRQDRGDSVNVASLTLSVHTGTHLDAPFHVEREGARIGEMQLDRFVGRVVVVDARDLGALDERVLQQFDPRAAQRVLFKTRGAIDPTEFPTSFAAPTEGLARQLVEAGIKLVGTDAPSMDDFHSKTLNSHRIFTAAGVALLENLVLTNVDPGAYSLIALPLKLTQADGSPTRAILLEGVTL